MQTIEIGSSFKVYNNTMQARTDEQVKNEPMLFNCDFEGASRLGGDITKEFLSLLPAHWRDMPLVIDSRVHMLMPGWFPCIPGWHHDDVPRTRFDGQPNYEKGQIRSTHIIALVNGDICPTQFAVGSATFRIPPTGKIIYEEWHRDVELLIANKKLEVLEVPTNKLVEFNDRSWHQGQAAKKNGWRFFIRASRHEDSKGRTVHRGDPRTNEVRKQVQVYMENPFKGW